MKIWFDARMLGFSGIGTQVEHTLSELIRRNDPVTVPIGSSEKIRKLIPSYDGEVIEFTKPIYSLSEQIQFPKLPKNTILHIPHYAAPIRWLSRSVVMVHDLIHLQSDEFSAPHFRAYAYMLLRSVANRAKSIITVSNYTRDCLVEKFPKAANRITVIHNGIDHKVFYPSTGKEVAAFKNKFNLPELFFLCVGIGKRHKNVDFVIRALSALWKNSEIDIPLVLAGTGGSVPGYVQQAIRATGSSSFIQVMPFLDESELRALYSSATALIMPSLIEGFGFPAVESMACGTPVIVSNRASLPEICGKAGLYFNPEDESDLQEKIVELTRRPSLADRMVASGINQSARFTWQEHVDLLISVYRSL
ncbi:MAG: glycosyltransferase family 4 protein [Leptonema sp. (in: Bacteria)]|nr:glycosyltransferase family 4 protein [Leptonema sp. (in: bacteria)]